jgi:hypothetical protein
VSCPVSAPWNASECTTRFHERASPWTRYTALLGGIFSGKTGAVFNE